MLYLNLEVGDALSIDNGRIVIHLASKSGQELKIGVDADHSIPVKVVSSHNAERRSLPLARSNNEPRKRGVQLSNPRAQEGSS